MGKRISWATWCNWVLPNLIGIFQLDTWVYFLFSHKALIALSILLFSVLNGLALRKFYVILFVLLALFIWKMIIKVFFLNIMMKAAWYCGWLALLFSFVILSSLLITSNYFFIVILFRLNFFFFGESLE